MIRCKREVQAQMTTTCMQQYMESLLQTVNEPTAKLPHCALDVKLVPLSAKDDIEAYLVTFERIMSAHEIWRINGSVTWHRS